MATSFPELATRRVLVVEDELLVVMAVEDLLEEQGCELLQVASTVGEALERIRQEEPEVVILDRNLQGDRTTSVAEELKRRRIPFVVMTGYVSGIADDPALHGATCIAKPWSDHALLDGLARALARTDAG